MAMLRKKVDRTAGGLGQLGLEPKAVIGAYPGAAALFDATGAIVAANPSAESFVKPLQDGDLPGLVDSVRLVSSEAKPRVERIDIIDGDNEKALDVTLLPAL